MKLEYFPNEDLLSQAAADRLFQDISLKPRSVMCAASGQSTLGCYQKLTEKYSLYPSIFAELLILKLDEWGGIPMNNPHTCETFLQENLIKPLHINPSRYIAFDSNPEDEMEECRRISHCISEKGPLDLCILGLGKNGHIAFNEPATFLKPYCHIAKLSETSLQHSMAAKLLPKPTFGLTLGMSDILNAKKIILLMTGSDKSRTARQVVSTKIRTEVPASFLWLHSNITCLINEEDIQLN